MQRVKVEVDYNGIKYTLDFEHKSVTVVTNTAIAIGCQIRNGKTQVELPQNIAKHYQKSRELFNDLADDEAKEMEQHFIKEISKAKTIEQLALISKKYSLSIRYPDTNMQAAVDALQAAKNRIRGSITEIGLIRAEVMQAINENLLEQDFVKLCGRGKPVNEMTESECKQALRGIKIQ
jgi:division protein CdvB (Snf7/Vps24/ESCRT-III family)